MFLSVLKVLPRKPGYENLDEKRCCHSSQRIQLRNSIGGIYNANVGSGSGRLHFSVSALKLKPALNIETRKLFLFLSVDTRME